MSVVPYMILAFLLLLGCPIQAQSDVPVLPPEPELIGDAPALPSRPRAGGSSAASPSARMTRQCSPDQGMLVPHDQTRVAVLGYHNFSKTAPVTEMLMRTEEFRSQMQYIVDHGLTVISMQEFLEWRFGRRELPAHCVLITLDDGWRSVYTDAYPILREFGFPFTLFLYPDFLSGRGESMSPEMIREMMQHGATIGSHSLTHPYPSDWKAAAAAGDEQNVAYIDRQIGSSREKLSKLFGPITTYCYPGGYHTPVMLERMPGYGYTAAFTVVPGKVTDDEPAWQIHRYMIFGTDPGTFRSAMDFRTAQLGKMVSTGAEPGTLPPSTPLPPFPVTPRPKSVVGCDVPAITAQLSGVAGIDFSSVRMSVSGFGRVPAKVDHERRTVEWTPPCRIYMPSLSVHVTWNTSDGTSHKAEWYFQVDQNATAQ
ncbi:MAG TPA: polysaccharide deacetylase family protein [Candidatus Akkermansia intestinavium]|nr:polysaccharide deacetylase family protein [Candidatus Akkermansia intestinavium]